MADLFERALERPPDQRTVWLIEACPDDASVRDEVVRMIDAHESDAVRQSSARGMGSDVTEEGGGQSRMTRRRPLRATS